MTEANLSTLHPLHFSEVQPHTSATSANLHGSFSLNLPRVSRSPELSRAYQVGDPVSLIDWKAYARTDQLIVRQERDEATARVVIALDARPSMLWPNKNTKKDIPELYVTKFSIAARIALHLVHRHLRKGDRVRLVLLHNHWTQDDVLSIELRTSSDVLSFFEDWEHGEFDPTQIQPFLNSQELLYKHTHLVHWISDCCSGDIPENIYTQVGRVSLFHILSHWEYEPAWFKDRTCYYDELSETKEFLGKTLKEKDIYRKKLRKWCTSLRALLDRNGGSYLFFTDRSPLRSYAAALDEVI